MVSYRISDEEYHQSKEWLREYINKYCIVRNTRMPGKAKDTWYTWIFYLRRGLFNPDFNIHVAKMFLHMFERIDPEFNFQITGLETAAYPMLTAIPMVAKMYGIDLNAYVVRKNRKEYGLLNIFEGRPNQKVSVIIDDLCNSTTSMGKCYHTLEQEGMEAASVAFAIVNKTNGAVRTDMHLPHDIQVVSLFTLDDFGLVVKPH